MVSRRCSRSCRTIPCAPAGRASCKAAGRDLHRRRLRAHRQRDHRHPPARAQGPRLGGMHMHAGDGNVHTNIPVNSDDYEMLQTAHQAVAHHAAARSLDGVISGEHGIGITKLEFLTPEELAPLPSTSAASTPKGASTGANCYVIRAARAGAKSADIAHARAPRCATPT